ncbi:DMT family transporter [Alkalihalobacterium bogoriense]|uniref:DMT family transporter n=1 Tax=Alkalihalobacterium bogoriense TaxID=246272 RepID=UPI00047E857D|nr:DMT family transporter [Alkalihalobacterium bogoriense]
MSRLYQSYLYIIIAMVIVGSSVVVGKVLVSRIPVFLASEFRFLIASLILIPIWVIKEGRPTIDKREGVSLFFQAFCGVFLFSIFMLYGLKETTALEAGMLTSTLPAIVACIAVLILKEKISKITALGILFAVAGTILVNMSGHVSEVGSGNNHVVGNSLVLGAVISEALFIILGKASSKRVSPLTITTVMSIWGVLFFLPFSLYELRKFNLADVSLFDWGLLLYYGIFVTVLAFLFMYKGISEVPASHAGVATSVLPLAAVVLSVIFLHEPFSILHGVGLLCVLLAIFIISTKEKQKKEKVREVES